MQDTTPCVNCSKPIPTSRLIVHETFCVRHMTKCPQCPEIVYKSELSEHIEEEHSFSKCLFCDIELRNELLESHVIVCGSRTDQCPYCDRNIKRMDFKEHTELCAMVFEQPNIKVRNHGSETVTRFCGNLTQNKVEPKKEKVFKAVKRGRGQSRSGEGNLGERKSRIRKVGGYRGF